MRQWPQELRHPLFLVGAVLYLLLQLNRRLPLHWPLPPLITSYLADALALPLKLTLALWFMRRVYFHQPRFVLPAPWIFSTWVVVSVWFEGVLPHLRPDATADAPDILAYALGGLVFWRWMNCPAGA